MTKKGDVMARQLGEAPGASIVRCVPKRSKPGKGRGASVVVGVVFADGSDLVSAVMNGAHGSGMRRFIGALPVEAESTVDMLGAEAWGRASGSIVDEFPTTPDKLSGRDGVMVIFTYTRNGKHCTLALGGAWGEGLTARPMDFAGISGNISLAEIGEAAYAACSA